MLTVGFHDFEEIADGKLAYVVACARHEGKWIFCRHKARSGWELPGGRRELGETLREAMERELWEETGAVNAELIPLCVYSVTQQEGTTYGALYFAKVLEIGELPKDYEIGEISFRDHLPEDLTYPEIQPELYSYTQGWMNLQSNPGELWDVYDENRCKTGKLHRRGDPLKKGEYHLVVHVWIRRSDGRFLLTKRSPDKGFPNLWESTGGSALAGDDSLQAALREVREEMGLTLDPAFGERILSAREADYFRDVWLFRQDFALEDVVLQPGETVDKMLASTGEIRSLVEQKQFVPYDYLDALLSMLH